MLVDPRGAALKLKRNVLGFLYVFRPDRAAQSVRIVIGAGDHLVDIGVADDRQNRAELFFVDQRIAIVEIGYERDGKEQPLFRRFATKQQAAAAVLGGLGQSRDLIELHAVLDRTENAVLVQAVADRNGSWQRR